MRIARFTALGMVLFAAACASGGGGGGGDEGSTDRYVLTSGDLAQYATYNLYETIRRARRFWLQGTGGMSPKVFVNEVEMGGAPSLEEYMADMVAEVRFIQPNIAMTQYGPDYAGGVIQVTLR